MDIMGRMVAAHVWPGGTPPVIVDNRGGAAGNIGMEALARSAPDGYAMGISIVMTLAVSAHLYTKLAYDPVRDLAPVAHVGSIPAVIVVHPTLPAKSVKELVALARKYPGDLNFGSAGVGTSAHFAGEQFAIATGTKLVHVPYKGNAPAMQDLVGGRLQLMFDYLPAALPFIGSGKVRALAVGGSRRSQQLPGVPTFIEAGVKDYVVIGEFGIFCPAGTPAAIVQTLNRALNAMLESPDYRARLTSQGADVPAPNSPATVAAMLNADLATAGRVITKAGMRIE